MDVWHKQGKQLISDNQKKISFKNFLIKFKYLWAWKFSTCMCV